LVIGPVAVFFNTLSWALLFLGDLSSGLRRGASIIRDETQITITFLSVQ